MAALLAAASASSRATLGRGGGVVDEIPPGASPARMPSGPRTTERRSSSLPTQVNTISAAAAASRGVAARRPPKRAHQCLGRGSGPVEDRDRMALACQMAGHRKAHHTQSDEGHSGHADRSSLRARRTLVGRPRGQQGAAGRRCHRARRGRYSRRTSTREIVRMSQAPTRQPVLLQDYRPPAFLTPDDRARIRARARGHAGHRPAALRAQSAGRGRSGAARRGSGAAGDSSSTACRCRRRATGSRATG